MNIDSILVVILKVFKKPSSKEANLNISNSQERKRPYIQTVDYGLISLKLKPSVKYSVTWHAETLLAYNFICRCFVLLLSCLLCFLVLYSPMVKVIECENWAKDNLRDPTWTSVLNISFISWAIVQLTEFLQWSVVFRPSCCGYWQVLSGRQYLPKLCLCLGQTANFDISLWDRWKSPALAKINSYSVTFTRERWQLFKW